MLKELTSILCLLATPKLSNLNPSWNNGDSFNIEENVVFSVKDEKKEATELRLYAEDSALTISNHVFDSCSNLDSLMITYKVSEIGEQNWPVSLTHIYFSGSEAEWANLHVSTSAAVSYYALDEGFIYYWNTNVRPETTTNLCDRVSKSDYKVLADMFNALGPTEQSVVNSYVDKAKVSIQASMKYLDTLYNGESSREVERETSPSLMIGIIIAVSTVGMTFIAVLYLLKEKKIIE